MPKVPVQAPGQEIAIGIVREDPVLDVRLERHARSLRDVVGERYSAKDSEVFQAPAGEPKRGRWYGGADAGTAGQKRRKLIEGCVRDAPVRAEHDLGSNVGREKGGGAEAAHQARVRAV